jgi:hypothetical protein
MKLNTGKYVCTAEHPNFSQPSTLKKPPRTLQFSEEVDSLDESDENDEDSSDEDIEVTEQWVRHANDQPSSPLAVARVSLEMEGLWSVIEALRAELQDARAQLEAAPVHVDATNLDRQPEMEELLCRNETLRVEMMEVQAELEATKAQLSRIEHDCRQAPETLCLQEKLAVAVEKNKHFDAFTPQELFGIATMRNLKGKDNVKKNYNG